MSARSPLVCSAVELWYKKMLKIGSLSELTGIDTKIKVAGFQRLYSKWLWLLMAVYKPLFANTTFGYYFFSNIGYRYISTKGFLFRIGLSPSFSFNDKHGVTKEPFIYPYISFGYSF